MSILHFSDSLKVGGLTPFLSERTLVGESTTGGGHTFCSEDPARGRLCLGDRSRVPMGMAEGPAVVSVVGRTVSEADLIHITLTLGFFIRDLDVENQLLTKVHLQG